MTVQEIKAAIPSLTLAERAEIARCLHGWEGDAWEAQMKRELVAGKLDKLLSEASTAVHHPQPMT